MRLRLFLCAVAAPAAAFAQSPRQLTADDYAKAERFLPQTVTTLVHNQITRPTWLAGGALWYRVSRMQGAEYMLVEPATRTRRLAFPHGALAAALAQSSGGAVDSTRLVVQEMAPDRSSATLTARGKRWRCTLGATIA